MDSVKKEENRSMVDTADAELVRAVMEFHLAEAATYCLDHSSLEVGLAESIKAEALKMELARSATARKGLEDAIEVRKPAGKHPGGYDPVGLLGVYALVHLITGMLVINPSIREEPGVLPEMWADALELADSALNSLIPNIPEPREEAVNV